MNGSFSVKKMCASMARKWARILAGMLVAYNVIPGSDELNTVITITGIIMAALMLLANIVKHSLGKYSAIFKW